MDAALRAYHCRKVVNNQFVAGHCYFEAQALSNSLTNELGDKKGAALKHSLYSAFYGGPAETLWPLRLVNLNGENARSIRSHLR